jgi:hypothetical protein
VLSQTQGKLLLNLRTNGRGAGQVELCAVPDAYPFHLAVTYENGVLVSYRNGAEAARSKEVTGDFSAWTAQHLVFGSDLAEGRNWPGCLEGVALFSRALTATEIQAEHKWFCTKVAPRKPPRILEIKGKLTARSTTPKKADLGPYNRALVTYEYDVENVTSGKYDEKKIRVMHWGIVSRQPNSSVIERPLGKSCLLRLEALADNPQLQSEMLCDDLPIVDLPLYYDLEP